VRPARHPAAPERAAPGSSGCLTGGGDHPGRPVRVQGSETAAVEGGGVPASVAGPEDVHCVPNRIRLSDCGTESSLTAVQTVENPIPPARFSTRRVSGGTGVERPEVANRFSTDCRGFPGPAVARAPPVSGIRGEVDERLRVCREMHRRDGERGTAKTRRRVCGDLHPPPNPAARPPARTPFQKPPFSRPRPSRRTRSPPGGEDAGRRPPPAEPSHSRDCSRIPSRHEPTRCAWTTAAPRMLSTRPMPVRPACPILVSVACDSGIGTTKEVNSCQTHSQSV